MKRILMLVLGTVFLLAACSAENGIEVHTIWMRPTAQGENAAIYFVLHNHSSNADELIDATSEAAEAVEFHESTTTAGDVIQMNKLSSVPLGPFAEIKFTPGGMHIMLIGLKREVRIDDHVEVVLHFKNSEDLTIVAHVEDTAPEDDHPHE